MSFLNNNVKVKTPKKRLGRGKGSGKGKNDRFFRSPELDNYPTVTF